MSNEVKKVSIYKKGNHYYVKYRGRKVWLSPELAKILINSE